MYTVFNLEREMKMTKPVLLAIGLVLGVNVAHAAKKDEIKRLQICKKECPSATTDREVMNCVEKLARLNKNFTKENGACWAANEQFEKELAATDK